MALAAFKDVTKAHDASVIFEEVTFDLEEGQRVGIVGPNGSGKSTLCSLLMSQSSPDEGDVMLRRGATIGYLEQHNQFAGDHNVVEEGMKAYADVFRLEESMRKLEEELATDLEPKAMERALNKLQKLQEEFDQIGGYGIRAKVESILIGLGMSRELLSRSVSKLSGGEAGRLALGKLLLREPDLLILDEPTNHLDIAGCEWLESYLEKYKGTALIVSHDRYFLDRVTKRTLELAAGGLTPYGCGYSEYEVRKEEERVRARKVFGEQQDFIRKEREFIKKHMGTQRTKEAKGRLKRLMRLEMMEPPRAADQEIKLSLAPQRRLGTEVVEFKSLTLGYGDTPLLTDLDLRVENGDRLGIVGSNGAGKSTLVKALMDRIQPISGEIALGKTVDFGYFDQLQASINPSLSPYEEIAAADLKLTDLEIRSFLARFLFGEDDVHRPLSSFSGGEKSKLMLAKLILAKPNVLVLDEPTNHLDIPSRKALEAVLDDYPGVIITVSHDRFFLDRICNRILWLDQGTHEIGTGNFSSVRDKRRTRHAEEQKARDAVEQQRRDDAKKKNKLLAKEQRKNKVKKRSLAQIESDIMTWEDEKATVLKSMEDPEIYRDPALLKELQERLEAADETLEGLEEEWEQYIE